MSPHVICLGHSALDYLWQIPALADLPVEGGKCRADSFVQVGGGMAATAAVTVARLGLAVQLWSRAGQDAAGLAIRDELAAAGVGVQQLRLFAGSQSSASAILVDAKGERLIVNARGHGLPTAADWLPLQEVARVQAVLADPRWPEGAKALFTAARQRGVPTVLDADVAEPAIFAELLPLCDHALFSEPGLALWADHCQLGHASIETQLRAVQQLGCKVAAVTLGAQGVQWLDQGSDSDSDSQSLQHTPARPVRVVDTTGAGDVFHGAYATALALGHSSKHAFSFASSAAALKCQHAGGRQGIPTMEETVVFNNSFKDREHD